MTNQELIQEAAVIRDERNQYANTAERVGTALVHMAEQMAAQGDDVDKIEADVKGKLTLSQLDNPFGFTTVAQWMQGLRGEQSYTFRLVEPTTGRCIGHVWLFNDADNHSNSNFAARTLEVVMCCATINAETGRLTYDAITGSPRIYYRSYCVPLTGGTPDGGFLGNGWSTWQEYREYIAKPIKDALAALQQQHATDVASLQQQHATDVSALQQQHATDVAELQQNIDAAVAAIPSGVLNLGMQDNETAILSRAAKEAVAYDPFIAVITAQHQVGRYVKNIIILQQVTKNNDGTTVCNQYVFKDRGRYIRTIQRTGASGEPTVTALSNDGVRNLYYTEDGYIGHKDSLGVQVGTGVTIPNKNALREGTPTLTTLPIILTKNLGGTYECVLNAATTARAGVMTAAHVQKLANLEARIAALEAK